MDELFETAKRNRVDVEYGKVPENLSLSVEDNSEDFIVLDYSLIFAGASERVHMAHELGHCLQGAFYRGYSPFDNRCKHEARANRWAIQTLVPLRALRLAVQQEYVCEWQLAEYFCVTPEFMHDALEYWTITRGEKL